MAIHELNAARDEPMDIASDLEGINYVTSTEPADNASQEAWRDYALEVLGLLIDAEKVTDKAAREILN